MRQSLAIVVLVATTMVAGCAEEPPYYGPLSDGRGSGYTEQQIDQNHYRITYSGNTATPRVTVENFLLLRSAQVSLQAGYPYFEFDTRDTKAKTAYLTTFTGWPGWRGYGWYHWGGPPGFDDTSESRPITRYEAYAEIVLLSEAQGKSDPRALEARSVVDHLQPLVPAPHS